MKIFRFLFFSILIFLTSCEIKPEPIQYGMDGCHFCSMTIVDRQHAAEFVTSKGKVFKFDAVECMMNQLNKEDISEIALFLVNDYVTPGELVSAQEATYLISENIPSPMGAYLSAFENKEDAERVREANTGILLDWKGLQEKYKN
ncbi:nitrous oxide reductase accessory protein NosL [Muriicola sp.]|uniref:nitrous oxide reductase accessory protein NosL n=2 Tax=Muriicola sp. TaxID=2020856 RepID=UPI00356859B0